jgi:3',5'-cyclic-AMP phosphodiesterase
MSKFVIAQITDSHIVQKGDSWQGNKTIVDERLKKVCTELNEKKPDVVIATGDLVDVKEAYGYFKEITSNLTMPMFVIPGNHDDREAMKLAFSDKEYMPETGFIQYAIDDYPVRLIGLDTLVPGSPSGELDEERLDWLNATLSSNREKPTIIFMHHFPFTIGHKIFDQIICFAGDRFEKIIGESPNVMAMFAGHYHHQVSSVFAGKPFFIASSVAPSHKFSADESQVIDMELKDPAITYHTWHEGKNHITSMTSNIVGETANLIEYILD